MMATTHVLAGMLLGLAVAPLSPGDATTLVLAGAAGGLAPDLDAFGEHRRDLHFPIIGSLVALTVLAASIPTSSSTLALLGAFVGAAALHAVSDVLGGGRSLRPWEDGVERAVYSHVHGRWWRPRELIPYDGSAHDLALAAGLGLLTLTLVDVPSLRTLVAVLLVVSTAYALVRRHIPAIVERVHEATLPNRR